MQDENTLNVSIKLHFC